MTDVLYYRYFVSEDHVPLTGTFGTSQEAEQALSELIEDHPTAKIHMAPKLADDPPWDWDNAEVPIPEPGLSRLKAFDAALCTLDDFEAYKRGEKNLLYYFVADNGGYGQSLSFPVATKEEVDAAMEVILTDNPRAGVTSNMFLA